MRLDNDGIRDIMLYIEDHTDYEKSRTDVDTLCNFFEDKYDLNKIYYHLSKLNEAGLVPVTFGGNRPIITRALTWEGHQYLDNIREDHIWKAVKEKANTVGSVSLQVMIPLATAIIQQKLGLS